MTFSDPFILCNTSDGKTSTRIGATPPAEHQDILWRLSNGPRGTGWTCTYEDEYQLIGDARDEIELLRYQLAGAQGINKALRHLANQIDLGQDD
jgi:hypothetical protein